MTVTNYFPRKEELAVDLHEAVVALLARTVAERAPGESALTALRRTFLTAVAKHDTVSGSSDPFRGVWGVLRLHKTGPAFAQMITASPALVARLREFHEEREGALAAVLAAETGAAPGDLLPQLVAAQFGGVHRVLFHETLRRTLNGQHHEEITAALTEVGREAFDLLEPALADYAVRPAP